MRKLAVLCLLALLTLHGCAAFGGYARYTYEFMDTFDTVISVIVYARSDSEAEGYSNALQGEMRRLHRLYDRYHAYPDVNNVYAINQNAGVAPVKVEPELMALLAFARGMYDETGGRVDITLGPVIDLWRVARDEALARPNAAALPESDALSAAGRLCGMDYLKLDPDAGTAYLTRQGCSLDVGAVAKGYACELAAQALLEMGCTDFLINGGGNVKAVGCPPGAKGWVVGIREPDDPETLLATYTVTDMSIVTSGDYQRYYIIDGRRIHHIIDPDTFMPGELYRSVSVICRDSGLADFLSTTLFLTPMDEARELCAKYGVRALMALPDGQSVTIE